MDIRTSRTGDHALVVVAGELDADTSPSLDVEFATLGSAGARAVTVDLADVTFLGSSGLTALLTGHRSFETFHLLQGNRIVDRLITMTGLEMLYGVAETP